jgi:hypothetical protein
LTSNVRVFFGHFHVFLENNGCQKSKLLFFNLNFLLERPIPVIENWKLKCIGLNVNSFYSHFDYVCVFKCRLLLFPPYSFLARPIFFLSKMPLRFSNFKIRTEFFSLLWDEKNEFFINSDFIIRKPQKIGRFTWIFRIIESEHP